VHCHLGSQITEVTPYLDAVRVMVDVLTHIRNRTGRVPPELDLVGGHGIAYRPNDPALDVAQLARAARRELQECCERAGLPVPHLSVEPGRALVGPAGVVLYRVAAVKRTRNRTSVVVDGGMSDNPRPALYGAQYHLLAVPAAGAYQLSMSSNYNAVPRPAVVAVRDGEARLLVRRETLDDLARREVGR